MRPDRRGAGADAEARSGSSCRSRRAAATTSSRARIAAPLAKRLDIPVIVENKAGRCRRDRRRFRRQVAARRIGAAADVVELPDRGRDADAAAVRPDRRVRAGRDDRARPDAARRLGDDALQVARGSSSPRRAPSPARSTTAPPASARSRHLTTELLDDTAKIQMTHVPYKGAANAAVDLAGGQIQVMMSNYSTLAPLMKSGKIKALAVTSKQAASGVSGPAAARCGRAGLRDRHLGRRLRARGHAGRASSSASIARSTRSPHRRSSRRARARRDRCRTAISAGAFAARIKDELAQWKQIATEHKIVAE